MILNWKWFWPPGDIGNFWSHFWLSQLGVCGPGWGATDIWWVEARDVNILPHTRQSPQQLYGQLYGPNVNSAEAEKPYLRGKVLSLSQENEDRKHIYTPTYTSRFALNLSLSGCLFHTVWMDSATRKKMLGSLLLPSLDSQTPEKACKPGDMNTGAGSQKM